MTDRLLKDAADALADEALAETLSRFVACDLDDAETEALQERLRDDPAAQDALILLTLQAESIRQLVGQPTAQSTPPEPDPEPVVEQTYPIYRKGCEPQPFKLRPHHFALIAATLLAACGLAAYLLTASVDPEPDPVDPNQPPPPVATLIHNTGDLRTPHGYPAEGDDYGRGEYNLASGTAEFMLTNAVNVKLRGDTRMYMRNNMNVALTRGNASFVVPKDAKGFTVHLPDRSRIVDLGTAFRVETNDAQRIVLRVTGGKVEWHSSRPGVPPTLVEAGTAIEIVEGTAQELTANASLIAHWKFDEGSKNTAADSSPNGHHATATGSVEWTDGKVGGATRRPAFRVTDSGDFRTTEPVSVSAWVKPSDRIGWAVIAGIDSYGESDGDFVAIKQDNAGRVQWSFGIEGREITSTETLADLSAAQEDGWVHLVGAYEPGKSSTFYVNGEWVGSMAAPIVKPHGETPFGIGVYANRDDVVFDGAIDDVQVYSTAVSADQVRELYENPGESLDSRPHTDSQSSASDQHVVGTERQSDRDLSERENETSYKE